jgi:hypothetical protein
LNPLPGRGGEDEGEWETGNTGAAGAVLFVQKKLIWLLTAERLIANFCSVRAVKSNAKQK